MQTHDYRYEISLWPAAAPSQRLLNCRLAGLLAALLMSIPVWAETTVAGCGTAGSAPTAVVSGAVGRLAGLGGRLAGQLGARGLVRDAAEAVAGGVAETLTGAGDCESAAAPATAATPATQVAATAPVAQPRFKLPKVTGGQAKNKSGGRNCGALGAGCADGMTPLVNCMKEKSFWGETALALERKRDADRNYTAAQLAEIDADIAAMWVAHREGSSSVTPVDPARPNRHQDWFTGEEQGQLNTAIAQTVNSHRQYCNSRYAKF
ncbi:hypothetical protein [Kineobactrum salinum]|uniref:Uncharacterized protein n=1 Tax=Kineobactrum salinum TaxID=2708301 RepID=A0A6C0TWD9_9GAMM|nr:hypothetical protein [Kineobactrum salinum]QIB64091.1 hypothetical protein G3T16_00310 [Kineobactrum salinum]